MSTQTDKHALVAGRFSWDSPEVSEAVFSGWHDPSNRWNGWAAPAFEKDEADRLMAFQTASRTEDDEVITFDAEKDAYLLTNPGYADGPEDVVGGADVLCADGQVRHLYAIGAWGWTWSEVSDPETSEGYDAQAAKVSALALARRMDTVEDVRAFITACVEALGAGFHPDTPGADYINALNDPSFTKAEAAAFDVNREAADLTMDRLGEGDEDVYSLALTALEVQA